MIDDTARATGARLLTAILAANGVARLFAATDVAIPALAAGRAGPVAIESAAAAAAAAARARADAVETDRPGVCAVAGLTDAAIALAGAGDDEPALLVLAVSSVGDAPAPEVIAPAKAVISIDRVEDLATSVGRAVALARSGRPGAVVLRLPAGLLDRETEVPATIRPAPVIETHPGAAQMWELQKRLWAAKRPLAILGGAGWSATARRRFDRFAEKFDLPIVGATRPIPSDRDDPRSLGALGPDADPALLARLASADLVLAIGVAFARDGADHARRAAPAPHQTLVHVHADVAELVRLRLPDLAVHATVAAFAAAAEALEPPPVGVAWGAWRESGRAEHLVRLTIAAGAPRA